MKRSAARILTTHVGSLVRPPELMAKLKAKDSGQSYDPDELASQVRSAIKEVVRTQAEADRYGTSLRTRPTFRPIRRCCRRYRWRR